MKRFFLITAILSSFGFMSLSAQSSTSDWSAHKAKKWFKKKEWLNGLFITPHPSAFYKNIQIRSIKALPKQYAKYF